MSTTGLGVLALLAPLGALLLLATLPRLRRSGRGAALVSIAATVVSLAAALGVAAGVSGPGGPAVARWPWLPGPGGEPLVSVGLLLDPVAAVMLVVVAAVSLAVQLYSLGYLEAESPASLGRYYTFLALFTASMLGLAVAEDLVQFFVCWELVGLCSYLLIGFWYRKPEAARAAQKAFWTTKLGDLAMLAGLVILWREAGTFSIPALSELARTGGIAAPTLALTALLLFCGAIGKSAQLPLHVWLPDAMAGPTPVSALIHAATMVAAGVYLVLRAYPIFAAAPVALEVVAWTGAVTALVAALLATRPLDVKRVLAYSTISQLGFMMAALGAGGAVAGYFHLFTHAGFKALLFLAAGSLIHSLGTGDLRAAALARPPGTGPLWRSMPQTACLFAVGALALAGIWPFAGFFSKDEVLLAVGAAGLDGPLAMLVVAVPLTAFYIGRVAALAFLAGSGEAGAAGAVAAARSGLPDAPAADGPAHGSHPAGAARRPHESPAIMTVPMWALAAAAALTGWLAEPFARFLAPAAVPEAALHGGLPAAIGSLPGVALALSVAGLGAGLWYYRRWRLGDRAALGAAARLLDGRLSLDALYLLVYRRVLLGAAAVVGWVDRHVVDGAVDLVAALTRRSGDGLRQIQTGRAQDYVYGFLVGVLTLAAWTYLVRP